MGSDRGMGKSRWRKSKKPCSVCRRRFAPDARVGDRQRTCGDPECRREQKRRTQAQWSERNPSYWSERRLRDQAARLQDSENEAGLAGPPPGLAGLPADWAQDAIGPEGLVIIVFLARLLYRAMQDAMKRQRVEITREIRKYQSQGRSRRDEPGGDFF